MMKVIVFLLINTLQLINSASMKKKKEFYLLGGPQGLSNISTIGALRGNRNGYAGNNNPYVCSYGGGINDFSNSYQGSPFIANLQGGGGMNRNNYPYTSNSGDNSSCNSNIANSYANSCNPNQAGDVNAISNAYAVEAGNYILQ